MRKLFLVSLFLMAVSCSPELIGERDPGVFYVSPGGSDNNSGLTTNEAFLTIQRAFENLASGDTVHILPGTYQESTWIADRDFSLPVYILAEPGVIIDGLSSQYEGILIENCDQVIMRGIEVKDFLVVGINILNSSRISVMDCTVHDNGINSSDYAWGFEGYGINAKYSRTVLISNNMVYRNGPAQAIIDAQGALGTGINTYALDHSLIIDNQAHSNRGGGILVEDSSFVTVRGNFASAHRSVAWLDPANPSLGQWSCPGMWLDGGHDVTVINNSFGLNRIGIIVGNEDNQVIYGYVVTNNTLYSNTSGIMLQNISNGTPLSILNGYTNLFFTNAISVTNT